MATFYEFQPTLQELVQNGFLARQIEEGLDSELAYRRHATEETIGGRLGSVITISKTGRKGPVVTPLNPSNFMGNLDNGLTPSLGAAEQYQYTLSEWGDTEDVDLIGSLAACADLVKVASRNNGVQAAQSMERLAKIELFACYDTGNTWVRGDLSGTDGTHVHVDDIRGFQFVPVNGVLTAVSVSNPLPCVEIRTSTLGVSQAFNVTAAVADGTNASLYPGSTIDNLGNVVSDGVSGILTIASAGATPIAGDAIIAANAPKVVRPLNKPSYNLLNSGDACTLGLILDAVTRLSSNAVPRFMDGTYHFICDYAVMRQLFSDQQFLIAYASRFKSEEYQKGQIFELLGVTFIPTTEAYVQPPNPSLGINVPIRRSILLGAESLLQGNFDGLGTYMNVDGMNPIGGCMLVNNVAQIVRPPIDRMLRVISMTWTWIGDFTCPTDNTATPLIIPTASNATYKRAVVIETAG
jgi:hypothetical protein